MSGLALDRMECAEARAALAACCAAERWVEAVLAGRPYGTPEAARAAARAAWEGLGPDDWQTAIADHPRLGGEDLERSRFASTRELSRREQAAVAGSPAAVRERLARAQSAYEQRFGMVFLVHAAGKSAAEILASLERRMGNDPTTELEVAAGELRAITLSRFEAVLDSTEGDG